MSFDLDSARAALAAFAAAMDAAGYRGRYWITCGTLLGFRREGNFLKHDGDIDFAMHIGDLDEAIVPALEKVGFRLIKTMGTRESGYAMTFFDGTTKADIFFHYPDDGGGTWHAVTRGRPQVRYRFPPFDLAPAEFRGVPVTIPSPPETFLSAVYGPDWATPVRRWHYAYCPHNLQLVGDGAAMARYRVKRAIWEVKSRLRQVWRDAKRKRAEARAKEAA